MTAGHPQRYDLRRAVVIGALLSVAIALFALTFDSEDSLFPLKPKPGSGMHPLPPLLAVGALILLGMGLGTILSLYWANRRRMRAVCALGWGRVLSGVFLALLLPFLQFWGFPIAFGFALPRSISIALQGANVGHEFFWLLPTFLLIVLPLAYVVACLIISGVQSRLVRIALFGQIWLAGYGTLLLVFGFYRGNM